jgi:hypothetical protein
MWAIDIILLKMPKDKNSSTGENSTNLVTLVLFFHRNRDEYLTSAQLKTFESI